MKGRFVVSMLAAAWGLAWAFPGSGAAQHAHGGHARADGAELIVADARAAGMATLRLGPLALPARADHDAVAQPPERFWEVPFEGWLTAYAPRLVDAAGRALPGKLLHHVAFWNVSRSDFLCPEKEEHIFGAGGEMNEWIPVPGFGYRVERGDRIRVNTMFHNPTDTGYPAAYLEVEVRYVPAGEATPLADVYPVWIDVEECGGSDYDLPPGESSNVGEIVVPLAGRLLGVGGHLHDYGTGLRLESVSRGAEIAYLEPRADGEGRILSIPILPFFMEGGLPVDAGERLRVTATYDNRAGRVLQDGAMGIVVGYFLPDDPTRFSKFRRAPSR